MYSALGKIFIHFLSIRYSFCKLKWFTNLTWGSPLVLLKTWENRAHNSLPSTTSTLHLIWMLFFLSAINAWRAHCNSAFAALWRYWIYSLYTWYRYKIFSINSHIMYWIQHTTSRGLFKIFHVCMFMLNRIWFSCYISRLFPNQTSKIVSMICCLSWEWCWIRSFMLRKSEIEWINCI